MGGTGPASAPNVSSSGSRSSGLSNSSTFTSLNVTTRTFFTNRAGRYMSHTQASDIRSSKYMSPSGLRTCRSTALHR